MKTRLVFSFAAVGLIFGIATVAHADLVTNGGAETGDLTGWTTDLTGASSPNMNIIAAVKSQSQSTGTVSPKAGDWFFTFANQATSKTSNSGEMISMYQTGSSGLGSAGTLVLAGWVQTESYLGLHDEGEAVLTVYGNAAETSQLATGTTGSLISHGAWSSFLLSVPYSGNADHWKVELLGTVNSTTWTNVFYDDLKLTPAPGAVLLGAMGLGLVAWRQRRARKQEE